MAGSSIHPAVTEFLNLATADYLDMIRRQLPLVDPPVDRLSLRRQSLCPPLAGFFLRSTGA